MSDKINDSNDEVLAVEETVETPAEAIEEAVTEVPEETAAPVEVVEVAKAEKPKKEKVAKAADSETVALFAERNVVWDGVGKLKAGYNIVSKEEAEGWLSGNLKVRLASPEEIAARANA
jgi:chorismate mutase